MAFRQPTYQAPQRIYPALDETRTQPQAIQQANNLADEQEWILFSPSAASTTDRTYTTSTARTRTAGHSRISDLGSLDTAARSYDDDGEASENALEDDEEDGELDSLDSHLHEFRADPSVYGPNGEASGTVLPTHDGLGSFRLDQTAMDEEVQEHLYAFERFNPRRVKRRRESLELGMLELENERAAEAERIRRIEQWRIEQSQALAEEIQKETRRRKLSMSTARSRLAEDTEQEDLASLSHVNTISDEGDIPEAASDGLWNRITRRVIRDLMGIDDDLLSIIFGEALPNDDDLSTTPPASGSLEAHLGMVYRGQNDHSSWEYRLLERIARELGILVNQLSDHPGAFSTYLHTQQAPLPYAGLPVIPEMIREQPLSAELLTSTFTTSTTDQQFLPTLQTATQPVSIPITSTSLAASPLEDLDSTPRLSNPLSQPMTQEEWERELDIKMVFRYLRSRFTAKFQSPPTQQSDEFSTNGTAHLATASTADTAARAARVRQHHPLVTRQPMNRDRRRSIEKRTWKATVPSGGNVASVAIHHIRRGSSSCASERLSISGRVKRNSGSSKHYWDFGGQSVGSGSLIVSTGGMGSWGEV
jgi:hypothetical protein